MIDKQKNFATQVAVWCMVTVHVTVCLAAMWKIMYWAAQ